MFINNYDLHNLGVLYKVKINKIYSLLKTVLNQFVDAIPTIPLINTIIKLTILENIIQSKFMK